MYRGQKTSHKQREKINFKMEKKHVNIQERTKDRMHWTQQKEE